ncbi:class II glutamine amidotransferase [Aquisalimonas lutea]|uniref:class II glutamine amidotransferase n=1 Tax=Aquisalimonas lutea TaxID=1327750 RepID=UPI0025B43319|nr:class II glutamine amidotransferase [Aquisalimonas lutea]MDN3517249.1 class II glutamine amidotransferase [Aquisalimonas lutea]
MRLEEFLLTPPHSLIQQAHAPQETLSATVNADGIGFGWYPEDGQPAVYRSLLPAWAEPNLESLGRSLASRTWLANVRSATDPLSSGYANTQPFSGDGMLFLHNGFIEDFSTAVRGPLRSTLSPAFESTVHGTTDSEYLFALLRQEVHEHDGNLLSALRVTVERLVDWLREEKLGALLNIVVSQGNTVTALRHAIRLECPSLYTHCGHHAFAGGHLAASEPLDDDPGWDAVPPHHVAVLEPGHDVRIFPL